MMQFAALIESYNNGSRRHRVLEQGPPHAYTKELYQEKVAALYEHMYESHAERDENVYAEGA